MIFYYFDASAWVKRYCQEMGSTWVQNLFDSDQQIVCVSLGYVEVTATLARKRKARELDPPTYEEKVQELEEDWKRFFQLQVSDEAIYTARDIAGDLALKGADSVHLASALLFHRRFEEEDDKLILVASDHELKEAAQSSGLEVIDPEEQETQTSEGSEEEEQEKQD